MNKTGETGSKQLDIRKYPNRRYYDATHSRHLTLEEIRSLIRDGYDIKVTDSKTGDDITAQVLTQIILELESSKLDTLPVALLTRLIRVNDQLVKDFVEKYFNQAFQSWTDYQKQFEERLRQMQGMADVYSPFSAWTQAIMTPFATPSGGAPAEKPAPPNPSPSVQSSDATRAQGPDTSELRSIIKELQEQVADLQKANKGKRKRSPE
jgi:polyhydroxyalkanoate synthesis repressor PhaR